MKNSLRFVSAILAAILCGAAFSACANEAKPPVTDVTYDATTDAPPTNAPVTTNEVFTTEAPVTTEMPVRNELQTVEITPAEVSPDMKSFSLLDISLSTNTPDAYSESEYKGTIYLDIDPTYSYNLDYVFLKDGDAFIGIYFREQNDGTASIWFAPEPAYSPFRIRSASDSSDAIIEYTIASTGEDSFDVLNMAPDAQLYCYRYPNEAGNKYLGFSHSVKKSQGTDKSGSNEIFKTYFVLESEKYSQFTVYGGAVYPLALRNFPGCPDEIETYTVKITRYVNAHNGETVDKDIPYKSVSVRYTQSGLTGRSGGTTPGIFARITSPHFSPNYINLPLTNYELDSTVFYTEKGVGSLSIDTIRSLAVSLLDGAEEFTETPASTSNKYSSISFKQTVTAMFGVRYTAITTISLIPLDPNHFALEVKYSYSDVAIDVAGIGCSVSEWSIISRNYEK